VRKTERREGAVGGRHDPARREVRKVETKWGGNGETRGGGSDRRYALLREGSGARGEKGGWRLPQVGGSIRKRERWESGE
jgi:hypothetical protein